MRQDERDPLERARAAEERHRHLDSLFRPLGENHIPDIEWIVQGLIPKGYLVVLAADPKAGKTSLATALALAVATGTPFAGIPTEQTGVLWLAQEEGPTERSLALAGSPLVEPTTPLLTCYQHLAIDQEDSLMALDHWMLDTDSRLIVIDPLHGATSGRSLADGWAARKTLMGLKNLCALRNATAIVLHHSKEPSRFNRKKRVAESAQLAATASMQIVLSSRPTTVDEGTARLVTLECQGRGEFANRTLHLASNGPLDYGLVTDQSLAAEPDLVSLGPVEMQVLTYIETGPKTTTDIRSNLPVHQGSVRNAITRLRAKGIIAVVGYRESKRLYGLVTNRH